MTIVLAVIIGLCFGFVLQKVGAADPRMILAMLRFRNLHLMKAILLAIGLSSLALFGLLALGLVDAGHFSVKSSYIGVIVGGAILGAGWAMAGFCPGTGVVALGAGRKDAWVFIAGGLLGAFTFMVVYAALKGTLLFDKLGGKATLANTGNDKYPVLIDNVPAIAVAGSIALIFIIIAFLLPAPKSD
ncbi:MAG: hypothetical protein CSA44_01255 [Gammaproteobacteria bacterium]|nr:MAG: hypothetical protein CSA44_01255 [Gammaproteobacteria bacterium]